MEEDLYSVLGEPYFSFGNFTLYNMDCVEGMTKLSGELFVNLTVTSPPYNIGKEYEKKLPLDAYIEWCEAWIRSIHNITTYNGTFWLNLGYMPVKFQGKAVPISYLLWDKTDFFLQQEIVWHYGAGVACKKSFSPRNEKFLWYIKDSKNYTFNLDAVRDPNVKYPNQKKNGRLRCNPLGKNPSDVWIFPKVTSGKKRSSCERTKHPAQFPEAVIERIMKASSNEGDLVLDPFMGSGTTAVVALRLNRRIIGFEIREDYCEIIKNRVSEM